jgi:hypothetical protein
MQLGSIEVADYRTNAGGYILRKRTTALYRDPNAWYHLYVAIDRSLATAADRCKIYVNGERVTDFLSSEDQDYSQQTSGGHSGAVSMNNDYTARIGTRYGGDKFEGILSHMYWVDGSVIALSEFGETDSTTGEWKIKTNPTISSYGTNGFLILKDGNTITDQSGGSYDFTSNGTGVTNTEDCPSNVFATWNPLNTQTGTSAVFQNGNTSFAGSTDGAVRFFGSSTLGMTSGKWYMEYKSTTGSNVHATVGVSNVPEEDARNNHYVGQASRAYGYYLNTGQYYNNSSLTNYGNSATSNGDIIGIALDLDNNKLYFSKNGTWQNSGDPTSGSTGTGAISISDRDVWFFQAGVASTTYASVGDANFGNGYFGTTAISSEGTNASGLGKFEYDVPTGYTALCTKGLNE